MAKLLVPVLAGAALCAAGCSGESESRAAAPTASETVLAVRYDGPPRLVRLRMPAMKPVSRAVEIGGAAAVATASPDGSRLAVGGGSAPYVRLVDLRSMRRVGRLDLRGAGFVSAIAWPRLDRLLVLVQGQPIRIAVVDARTRKILRTRSIHGAVSSYHALRDTLVLLVAPAGKIGPARLVTVDAQGNVRTVALSGVRAGGERFDDGTDTPGFREIRPGLAIDAKRRRAFVVPPGDRVLAVDLRTLRVREHALSQPISLFGRFRDWLEPTAQAKSIEGPTRYAAFYSGRLVVAAKDYHGLRGNRLDVTDHGVKLIDPERWTVRALDEDAGAFSIVAGRLLLYGGRHDVRSGIGLDAYEPSGTRAFSLFGGQLVSYVQTAGRYAVVSEENSTLHRVVDVRAGRVVATARTKGPTTFLAPF